MKHDIIALSSCVVRDEHGNQIRLSSLWQRRSAIFVFLRHFACVACRAHAVEVWRNRAEYQSHGGLVHFVGNGSPEVITEFKRDMNIQNAIVLTDPSLVSFRAAGLKRGLMKSIGLKSIANAVQLFEKGYEQKVPDERSGDLWQLGGVLVIQPDGRIRYQYISEALGDFPPIGETHLIAEASFFRVDASSV